MPVSVPLTLRNDLQGTFRVRAAIPVLVSRSNKSPYAGSSILLEPKLM